LDQFFGQPVKCFDQLFGSLIATALACESNAHRRIAASPRPHRRASPRSPHRRASPRSPHRRIAAHRHARSRDLASRDRRRESVAIAGERALRSQCETTSQGK
jgi:hypothetical protein